MDRLGIISSSRNESVARLRTPFELSISSPAPGKYRSLGLKGDFDNRVKSSGEVSLSSTAIVSLVVHGQLSVFVYIATLCVVESTLSAV